MRLPTPVLFIALGNGCAHHASTALAAAPFELVHDRDPSARFDVSGVESYEFGPGHRWRYVDTRQGAHGLPESGRWQLAGRRIDLHGGWDWPDPVYRALVVHDGRECIVGWSYDICDHLDSIDWTRYESRPKVADMSGFTLDFCATR